VPLRGRLLVSQDRDALSAAVRDLYAQELKMLGRHDIIRWFFSPLVVLETIAAQFAPIFLLTGMLFDFAGRALARWHHLSVEARCWCRWRGHHCPCVPLFGDQDGHGRRHHHQLSVISLCPTLVVSYVWLLHMLLGCVHFLPIVRNTVGKTKKSC
jgi:hypothetical protein